MWKTLLLVLTFSGLSVLSINTYREYHYVNSSKTWAEAQSYCREMFTDLATVDHQDDNDRLLSVIQGGEQTAWIGLYDEIIRWKWAMGNADFNNIHDYSNWRKTYPNNKQTKVTCVASTSVGQWQDADCEDKLPAVCFYEAGPSKYIFVQAMMTWNEAKNYCRSRYTDLVSVRSQSENNDVTSVVTTDAWIGLHRKTWSHWSDQTPATFTNWKQDQPDVITYKRTCTVVHTATGEWWDDDCETKYYNFICETVYYYKTTLKLMLESEADLNDPHIQQQILEQLHDKLKTHGSLGFKLHWSRAEGLTKQKKEKK